MIHIKHRLGEYKNKENIKILILGTFNPDTPNNPADFFYGRNKNYLWNLLPKVFGYKELKGASIEDKEKFMHIFKIGFTDIIQEVCIENGEETNYADNYIDNKVSKWIDFEAFINQFQSIEKVFFTRKTFSDVPKIKKYLEHIKSICLKHNIKLYYLPTPSRFENKAKLKEWSTIIKS